MYQARTIGQPESDRTKQSAAQLPTKKTQEPLQRAIDPGRLSFYSQILGHRPPPGLRLSPPATERTARTTSSGSRCPAGVSLD